MPWHRVDSWKRSETGEVRADIHVPPDSPWFCGHFPGEPILPGIAQVGIVFEALQQSCGPTLALSRVSRVRFKRTIRPDERLSVTATPRKEAPAGSYSFRITCGSELVCSGLMALERLPATLPEHLPDGFERSGRGDADIFDKGE